MFFPSSPQKGTLAHRREDSAEITKLVTVKRCVRVGTVTSMDSKTVGANRQVWSEYQHHLDGSARVISGSSLLLRKGKV